MPRKTKGYICLLIMPSYKVGAMPPKHYLQWHKWAEVQRKGGLRQLRCRTTGKFEYPQEHKAHAT